MYIPLRLDMLRLLDSFVPNLKKEESTEQNDSISFF